MVKTIFEADSMVIPKKELVDAAKKFLQHSAAPKTLVLVDNIYSPNFGSSDLLFINKTKTNLTAAKVKDRDNGEDNEKFIISSISYYFWLRQFVIFSDVFLDEKCGLDMYLFSNDFSAPIRYLIDNLSKRSKIYLIQYNILQDEDLEAPAVYFRHADFKGPPQIRTLKKTGRQKERALPEDDKEKSSTLEVSAEELSEFNRLKELYLE